MDNNKVLIILNVPEIDTDFDLMIPVSRKVGNLIELLAKFLEENSKGEYKIDIHKNLYNKDTGQRYNCNSLIYDTDIRNGTKLILI